MASGNEPSQPKKPTRPSRVNLGSHQAVPSPNVKEKEPPQSIPSPQTDGYLFERQELEPPRLPTSVVRYDGSRNTQTTRAHLLPPCQIPARRTKEMSPRNVTAAGEKKKPKTKVHW